MKKATLVLLCCSTFLYACDSSKDTANDAASDAYEKAAGGLDSAKESASVAMDAAEETVSEVIAEGKVLKDTAVKSTSAVVASVGADDARQGESIYKGKCVACHGTGVAGAPKLGDKADWEARIAQGNEVLTQHAIKGFKGNKGYMPPKGGHMSLSDGDISLVVQYMVSQAQ